MFLIDIAVPRDIEPEVANIDNVYLYNIDDLQSVVSQNIDERNKEVEKCRVLIEEEVEHFMARLEEMKIEPAITHLRNHFHTIGKEELDRLKPKLKNLDNGDWEQVILYYGTHHQQTPPSSRKGSQTRGKEWRRIPVRGDHKEIIRHIPSHRPFVTL